MAIKNYCNSDTKPYMTYSSMLLVNMHAFVVKIKHNKWASMVDFYPAKCILTQTYKRRLG